MEYLKYYTLALILGLIFVLLGYCAYNFYLVRRNHETLRAELKSRLFFVTKGGGHVDLITVVAKMLELGELKIEETGGIELRKQ